MQTNKNKFSKLRGMAPVIARECGCTASYVTKALNGARVAKTERAQAYFRVIEVAERILSAIKPPQQ